MELRVRIQRGPLYDGSSGTGDLYRSMENVCEQFL